MPYGISLDWSQNMHTKFRFDAKPCCSQGGCLPQCMLGYTPWKHTPLEVHAGIHPLEAHTSPEAHPPRSTPRRHTPLPPTVTAADGTHPTRMLSCILIFFPGVAAIRPDPVRYGSSTHRGGGTQRSRTHVRPRRVYP